VRDDRVDDDDVDVDDVDEDDDDRGGVETTGARWRSMRRWVRVRITRRRRRTCVIGSRSSVDREEEDDDDDDARCNVRSSSRWFSLATDRSIDRSRDGTTCRWMDAARSSPARFLSPRARASD